MGKGQITRTTITVALGLVLATSIGSQVLDHWTPLWLLILGSLGLVVVGFGLAFFLILKIIWPRLTRYTLKIRLLWIISCLIAGFGLVYAIPITVYPKANLLRIIATGEKNPNAKGSEVWLASVVTGVRSSLADMTEICKGDWVLTDGLFVSTKEHQPSELDCFIKSDSRVFVKFGIHPWSGMVQLEFDGQSVHEDLYAAEGDTKEIAFPITFDRKSTVLGYLLLLADGITLGLAVLAFTAWFLTLPYKPFIRPNRKPIPWYGYALPVAASWFIYLLAFWPGFLSPDTVFQFQQIATGVLTDWHPAFHTMTLWLLTRLWFSPAPVAIVQIFILSILTGWGLSMIEESGAPRWLTWPAAGFLALGPAASLMVLTLWKDVAYSIALLALTLFTYQAIRSEGKWLKKPLVWILLGVIAALVSLYRHNGMPVALGIIACLLLAYRRFWRPLVSALILMVILWVGVRGPLYQWVGVDTAGETYGKNLGIEFRTMQLIEQHIASGTQLLPEEKALLKKTNPQNQLDIPTLSVYAKDIDLLALRLTLRNPVPTLDFILEHSSFILQILQPPRNRYEFVGLDIYENPFGLKLEPVFPWLNKHLSRLIIKSETPEWDWLFWRNAFWMYMLSLATIIACVRNKSWQLSLLLVPVLLNALPLAIFSGGQIARYILPSILIGAMFTGYLLSYRPIRDQITDDSILTPSVQFTEKEFVIKD